MASYRFTSLAGLSRSGKPEIRRMLAEFGTSLDPAKARHLLVVLERSLADWGRRAGAAEPVARYVAKETLLALPVLLIESRSDPRRLSEVICDRWTTNAKRAFAAGTAGVARHEFETEMRERMLVYLTALPVVARASDAAGEARDVVQRLRAALDLSYDDAGKMLDVSGETVRRWEQGATGISLEAEAKITRIEDALDRLLALVRPDRIAVAIRRRAPAFENERALDWILRGRLGEVVNRYERELRYQP